MHDLQYRTTLHYNQLTQYNLHSAEHHCYTVRNTQGKPQVHAHFRAAHDSRQDGEQPQKETD